MLCPQQSVYKATMKRYSISLLFLTNKKEQSIEKQYIFNVDFE